MATAEAFATPSAVSHAYWLQRRSRKTNPGMIKPKPSGRLRYDTRALAGAVYSEMRALANRLLNTENAGHILQPTALVHEAYARLMQDEHSWNDKAHFLATAARTMRRILVDYARRTRALKRGAGEQHVPHNEELHGIESLPYLVALDEALDELNRMDPRQGLVVELRFFAGLNIDECAEVLGISKRTVSNDWQTARAWLYGRLKENVA
ncbi:MAG: ECF-type sigma factor [Acidobacteriota bacterium]|nr:ECF-type sigma factor [Acidobacteriota bacterium]